MKNPHRRSVPGLQTVILLTSLLIAGCAKQESGNTNIMLGSGNASAAQTGGGQSSPSQTTRAASPGGDRVEGNLTVNGEKVELKHVYAWAREGTFDKTKQDIVLVLVEQPLPEEKLNNKFTLLGSYDLKGIELTFEEDMDIISGVFNHPSFKSGYLSYVGGNKFEPVTFNKEEVEGSVRVESPREAFGDKWEYKATFKVKVRAGK